MQTTFLGKPIIILKRGQSYVKIRYESKKIDDFSLSQNDGFVFRLSRSYLKYYKIFLSIYSLNLVLVL